MNETEKRDRRDEKEEIRYHVIFYGQVQGVGFRYRCLLYTSECADFAQKKRKTAKNKKENRKTREMLDGREKEPYTKK